MIFSAPDVELLIIGKAAMSAAFLHQRFRFRQTGGANRTRLRLIPTAHGGGHSDGFAHRRCRPHHAHGLQSNMCHADIPAGHEEVRDIT